MKRITIFVGMVILLTAHIEKASAQYYFYNDKYYDSPLLFELGGSVGAMNCLTDLGGNKGVGKKFIKDLNLGKTQFAGSIYLSAMYQSMIALRIEATFGQVTADDAVLKKKAASTFGRYERNLSFTSRQRAVDGRRPAFRRFRRRAHGTRRAGLVDAVVGGPDCDDPAALRRARRI